MKGQTKPTKYPVIILYDGATDQKIAEFEWFHEIEKYIRDQGHRVKDYYKSDKVDCITISTDRQDVYYYISLKVKFADAF